MSSPARSTRSRKRKESLDKAAEEDDAANWLEETPGSDDKKNVRSKRSSRELRRKQRDGLRSRNMGVGLVIPSETEQSSSKHVVFDEEGMESDADHVEATSTGQVQGEDTEEHGMEDQDDDDDDAVEEVKSNVAREQAMQQRSMERETAKLQKLQSHTKKRKKTSENDKADTVAETADDEEFDDEFFAQVDSEMAGNREEQHDSRKQQQPMGRHTTFVSTHDEAVNEGPICADHNIELVVLGVDEAENERVGVGYEERRRIMEATMGTQPSEAALLFSRSKLVSGDDQPSKKFGMKEKPKSKRDKEQGWKRSKKMNRLAAARVRANRRGGRGVAAVHFAKQR